MRLVVKVGTRVLLNESLVPCRQRMEEISNQVVRLKKAGHQIVLVSSGSLRFGLVECGKLLGESYGSGSVEEKQVLCTLGQYRMLCVYSALFENKGMAPCQLLLTKRDLATRKNYLHISSLIDELFGLKNVIPIANENDCASMGEMSFSDNDELASLLATQINADKLIMLTHCGGLYTGNPLSPSAKLVDVLDLGKDVVPEIPISKGETGTGGMASKLRAAVEVGKQGIVTHISPGGERVLERILEGESLGTKILPGGGDERG